MQVPIANSKIDISFSNSLAQLKKSYIIHIVLHFIQFVTVAAMIPIEIYVFKHNNQSVLSFFITAACITFVNMTGKLGHLFCNLGDVAQVMFIATQLNHIVQQQQISQRIGEQQFNGQVIVSEKVYNIQNNTTIQQATPLVRQTLQPALTNMIKTIALSHDPLNRCAINLGSMCSFALFIYGIVVLATVPQMQASQIAIMCIFLVSQFIVQISFYLCLLFIAILPLLCLFICFYACFCKEGNKQAKLPQAIPATTQIIQKSDGQPCSICFQNIMLNERVIILPCQGQHTFHENCISTWASVKPTCPNCRFDLSQ